MPQSGLHDADASAVWTFYQHANAGDLVLKQRLLVAVNEERMKYNQNPITESQLRHSLRLLEKMRCISSVEEEGEPHWLLCEEAHIKDEKDD